MAPQLWMWGICGGCLSSLTVETFSNLVCFFKRFSQEYWRITSWQFTWWPRRTLLGRSCWRPETCVGMKTGRSRTTKRQKSRHTRKGKENSRITKLGKERKVNCLRCYARNTAQPWTIDGNTLQYYMIMEKKIIIFIITLSQCVIIIKLDFIYCLNVYVFGSIQHNSCWRIKSDTTEPDIKLLKVYGDTLQICTGMYQVSL